MCYFNKKNNLFNFLNVLKPAKGFKTFATADVECIIINGVHHACMFGLTFPYKGDIVTEILTIDLSYDSEKKFTENSKTLCVNFLNKLKYVCLKYNVTQVYFHNLNYDGFFLLQALTQHKDSDINFEPFFVENNFYSLTLNFPLSKNVSKELLIKCSFKLLPFSLKNLALFLLKENQQKLLFDPTSVNVLNFVEKLNSFKQYLKQDCEILYRILELTQARIFNLMKVDITSVLSTSGLAIKVFKTSYYDMEKNPIFILQPKVEQFIRQGFYGGHVDVYKPFFFSDDINQPLYHYDINSLYPFAMDNMMPSGKPIFISKFKIKQYNKEKLFGFFKTKVFVPKNLNKPLLPFRTSDAKLIFPTGSFEGVYFSEELKAYEKFGYKFEFIEGYDYPPSERSFPFSRYVKDLYGARLIAKAEHNLVDDFFYKLLLNCLYGRLGIKQIQSATTIIEEAALEQFIEKNTIASYDRILSTDYFLVKYKMDNDRFEYKKHTLNVACAAAITAYARIKMASFIYNHSDHIYYTDTDSLFLTEKLSDAFVDNQALGLFKFEGAIKEAYFIAPKLYGYKYFNSSDAKVKAKGLGKLDFNTIKSAYETNKFQQMEVIKAFNKNLKTLKFETKTIYLSRSTSVDKRYKVYVNDKYVDTLPIHLISAVKTPFFMATNAIL